MNYTFEHYADDARTTATYTGRDSIDGLIYAALGLAGEAGEVANQVKKIKRDDQGLILDERRMKLVDEIGDVLWYLQAISDELQIPGGLETVAQLNAKKLRERKKAGTINGDRRIE